MPPLQARPDSRSLSPFLCHTYVIHFPENTIMRLENIYVKYTIAFPWIEQQQIICVLRILPLIVTVNNVTQVNVTRLGAIWTYRHSLVFQAGTAENVSLS